MIIKTANIIGIEGVFDAHLVKYRCK